MALTPDQIKNLPPGENVSSVLFRKNLTANKNAGQAPKVGYQGSTELPSVTLTGKKLGKSIPKVEGEEPINTPRVKNYVEKPPWQKLGIYEANDIYSTLKDMYRQYDLGKVVHPGLAMGALFSPALTASAIPFLFQGENFRNKLKELSAKYQPETVVDIMTGLPQRTALQRGLNALTSIGQTTAKAWKADDYIRFKALDATLTTEEKKQLGWSGKYDESQVQNYLPSDESKKPLIWEAMKRPQYRQALDSFGNMSVKDVAGEYWSGIVSALKDEKQEVSAKEGTTQNVMQTVASRTQIHKNPVINTLMELNLDPTVVALPFSMGAKGAIQAAAKSGKLKLSKEVLTSLTKSDTLGEFALRIGAKKSWKEAATAVKSLADTPVFRKLADEAGFVRLPGKKAGENKLLAKFMTAVQDDWYRVRKLVSRKDLKVTDESNPYLARELQINAAAKKIEHAKDEVVSIDKDILSTSKKLKLDDKEFSKDVDKFLYYAHVSERNRALKSETAAGITTKEATSGLKKLNKLSHFEEVKRVANKLRTLHSQTLDSLLEAEVIDKKFYDVLRNKYKYHVPLNRIFDESEDIAEAFIGSRSLDVKGHGLKKAKGSEREVADVTTNIVHNLNQAIIRAEKNKVDLTTLKFVQDNKDILGDLFQVSKPKAIGKSFDGKRFIYENVNNPQILTLRQQGKPVNIKINDPNLAVALKGVNREKIGGFTKAVGTVTRFYAGLQTRFNPEFAIPNKLRDFQEMLVYMASRKEIGFKGAAKTVFKDASSHKAVLDFMRGKSTKGAATYKELQELGGTMGGMASTTRKTVELDIDNIRKLNRSKPRQAIKKIVDSVDNWNTLFEDSTRLTVYKQGLAQGLSKKRAAALAKEATIDFNRMGTAGPVINAWYMFANASIQGSVKMLRAMKNPKVLATVSATVLGANFAVQEYNDSIDPEWRGKVSEWDKLNGLNIVLPSSDGKFNYATVPVSWGLKPLNALSSHIADFANSEKIDIGKAAQNIFTSVTEAYNPAGGTDIGSAATPTVGDIPLDLLRNQKWSGSPIRPEYDKFLPQSEKYFDDLKEDAIGKQAVKATKKLSEATRIEVSPANVAYVIEQLIGGTGRTGMKAASTFTGVVNKEVKTKDIPFVSRFIRSRSKDEIVQKDAEVDVLTSALTEQSGARSEQRREAEEDFQELKKLPAKEAKGLYNRLVKENPEKAKLIYEVYEEDKLGLDYKERLIKQLGVKNGKRAKYIVDKLSQLKTNKEKKKYYQNLVNKKIITTQVYEQMNELMETSP